MKKSDISIMPEYFNKYINLVEDIDLLEALEKYGTNLLNSEIKKFEILADKIYAPAKWTTKDILQHIIDTERIYCYRAFRIARHDKTNLAYCDENSDAMNAKANDRELSELMDDFKVTRLATIELFKSFNNNMLLCEGIAANKNLSVLSIGFMIAGHIIHHLKVIEDKYYPLIM